MAFSNVVKVREKLVNRLLTISSDDSYLQCKHCQLSIRFANLRASQCGARPLTSAHLRFDLKVQRADACMRRKLSVTQKRAETCINATLETIL